MNNELSARAIELLKAAKDYFNELENSYYNKFCYSRNPLSETVWYDDAECDGSCLRDDIDALLFEVENI